jgi:hypothetical protein
MTPEISIEEKEYLEERGKLLLGLLSEILKSSRRTSLVVSELPEDSELSAKLARLADFYLSEVSACLGVVAFLSANVLAASTLEAFLLMKCLSDRTRVSATQKWQSLQNKRVPKPFLTLLLKLHLRDLFCIGDELSWFPRDGIAPSLRPKLVALFGKEAVEKLSTPANAVITFSDFAAGASTELRNLLHPGRTARIPADPKQSQYTPVDFVNYLGMFGCVSTLLAIGSFLENQP